MSRRNYRVWSADEARYLKENYGAISVMQVCSGLNRTRVQVWKKAIHMGLTKHSTCKTCGRAFVASGDRKEFFCSQNCRRKARTTRHRRYVAEHRDHLNEYVKLRRMKVWGESNSEIASKAEKLAMERILPKLGFTELYHASAIKRFVPSDIIATCQGRRVLIDVTTGASKGIAQNSQQTFADALRMPLYVLFIRPDFTKYQLMLSEGSKTIQVHLAELVAVE